MPDPRLGSIFELDHPQTVGTFGTYAEAQRAVDHLADAKFPVQNICIVGTDLRRVERVLGRKTWGTVLGSALMSGISMGLLVGLMVAIFSPGENLMAVLLVGVILGVIISLIFAGIGYATTRGQRDFNSVAQTIATKYEVLVEHKVADEARRMLAQGPGSRADAYADKIEAATPTFDPNLRYDPITGQPVPAQQPQGSQAQQTAPDAAPQRTLPEQTPDPGTFDPRRPAD